MHKLGKVLLAIVATPLLALAAYVAATWEPDRSVAELAPRWAPPPSTFVEVAGMRVHLRDEGSRNDRLPVVLLHGTASSLHTWEGWATTLSQHGRRVIRFDLPGFGLTGPRPDGDYGERSYVDFVIAMLDRLGVERCVLAGNSLGGRLAWKTALVAPARVERLVLVDASGYPKHSSAIPIAFRLARTPVLRTLLEYTLPRRMVESSVRSTYGDPTKVTPELVDRYFELSLRAGNRHALVERLAQPQPGSDADRIRELRLPTLILWGGRDRLNPPDDAERFHRDIAGSRRVIFDELGHVPQEEDPARTVAVMEVFLDS